MADSRPSTGLPTIFGIFLGLMVTAFIGVGVYTYYPSPDELRARRKRRGRGALGAGAWRAIGRGGSGR